jgi:hypothetical protein
MHLTVVLRDAQNNVLTGRPITFVSSSPNRISVTAAGVVTGIGSNGGADITATSEGKTGKVQLNASDAVASMTVVGPSNSIADLIIPPGSRKRYKVTLEDAGGRGINNQLVSVSSSNPSLLSFSNTSLITNGKGEAHVDITAANALVGLAGVTFTAVRVGAIPPGSPGSNNVRIVLPIAVP